MRNKCPECNTGFLVPIRGQSGRECTVAECTWNVPKHPDIVTEVRQYTQPKCSVDGCDRGADFLEKWPGGTSHACARHACNTWDETLPD